MCWSGDDRGGETLKSRIPSWIGQRHCLLAAVVMCIVVATSQASELLSLQHAVETALTNNPGLAALKSQAESLAALPEQAGAWPDPILSFNLVNVPLDSFSFREEGMTQYQLGLSQALPYPGKLNLRTQLAVQEARVAEADLAERRLQLIRDVRILWWNLYYLDRALTVIEPNRALLVQIINVAETRYQVGQGLQQDLLLAQLELSRLHDSAIRLHNRRENEEARLNVQLARPVITGIVLPAVVNEDLVAVAGLEELQRRAVNSRPLLLAQQRRVDAAQRRVALAEKDYAPDFKLAAIYGVRNGNNPDGSGRSDLGSLLFSMNLPFNTGAKQGRAVDQRNAEWLQQKYLWHNQRNQVTAEVRQATTDYQHAREQVDLFKQEIIPQARQTVEAMLAGYQAGKVDFLSLIRSQTTLYDYETEYWKVFSAANQALARLMAAAGEENIYE